MAKFNLKFLGYDNDNYTISVLKKHDDIINITTFAKDEYITISLDKSTAIKFAKTLRTEINKIKEVGNE